ncbi:trimeric intracellular cation channel family protein [Paenibacillus sp. 481]|uniref:trimeric intracellular cation channel family protein n=1 Tax=Paenibacillus sp. 481 TaxID=2835869 RepID=UPI001E56F838|nr:trimeric intracellular cation channel family protein [Paenibacillus sp. 481]UHA73117.1 trimeric intracellular cation channel family protein [Paenibacillus sp. 481]
MDVDIFTVFSFIGTIAFALSGAVVAMEEKYDALGIFVLGMVTAFGGGVVRNVLIGVPVTTLWSQNTLLTVAMISIAILFVVPLRWIETWRKTEVYFDAIGLSAFAIQGAMYAVEMNHPVSAVVVAAMLTGIGGGIIRDILAGRKPIVLQHEVYALWAILAGLFIALGWANTTIELLILFTSVVMFRMLSVYYNWSAPKRSL